MTLNAVALDVRSLVALAGIVLLVTGCGDQSIPASNGEAKSGAASASSTAQPRTVRYFLEHPSELDEVWKRCRNDPGGVGTSPECVNAGHANERAMMLGRERALRSLKD